MSSNQKTIALAVGSALALSITAGTANAANPFAAKSLSSGYQVAEASMKDKEGKCAEGKCSASMRAEAKKAAKEGKCSAEKMKDGGCHAEKAAEGSCSAEKMKDGSCHAQKK
jgi:uncharacterized low-complexity protein